MNTANTITGKRARFVLNALCEHGHTALAKELEDQIAVGSITVNGFVSGSGKVLEGDKAQESLEVTLTIRPWVGAGEIVREAKSAQKRL